MENKQINDHLEQKIKDLITEIAPESDLVDKKMEEAYKEIQNMQTTAKVKKKLPAAVKFSAAAAVLAFGIVYCIKNPAIAAQFPLIGNIFRELEGQVHNPGDYSEHSTKLYVAKDNKTDSPLSDSNSNPSDGSPSDSNSNPSDGSLSDSNGNLTDGPLSDSNGNLTDSSLPGSTDVQSGPNGSQNDGIQPDLNVNREDNSQSGSSNTNSSPSDLNKIQNDDPQDNTQSGKKSTDNTQSGKAGDKTAVSQSTQKNQRKNNADCYQKEVDGVTVTLSEVAYDHDAIYLAILVQTKKGFSKNALYPNSLCYDADLKLYKADGGSDHYSYKSEGIFVKAIEGEFIDRHTFKGLYEFRESGLELAKYTACDLTFGDFQQQLTTGEKETITVPDYGEVTRTIPDSVHYKGPFKFHLDLDGITIHEEEAAVNKSNSKGYGIEKVVKTAFEIYAVPILPDGTKGYDYIASIWDANGEQLEPRNWGEYFTFSHYGRDVSKVTVYLLKKQDFMDHKGNHSDSQPELAIYKTTASFEE